MDLMQKASPDNQSSCYITHFVSPDWLKKITPLPVQVNCLSTGNQAPPHWFERTFVVWLNLINEVIVPFEFFTSQELFFFLMSTNDTEWLMLLIYFIYKCLQIRQCSGR